VSVYTLTLKIWVSIAGIPTESYFNGGAEYGINGKIKKTLLHGGTMHGSLQKWLMLPLLFSLLIIPFPAGAQGQVSLDNVTVQLWPEFDQPSMLVIYDFSLPAGTSLPVDVTLHVPADANIIAVAYADSGGLLNAQHQAPFIDGDWQVLTITVDQQTSYHIEYYAPLTTADTKRTYDYLWAGDYAVKTFDVSLRVPVDTTDVTTNPTMKDTTPTGSNQKILTWSTSDLKVDEQVPINLSYTKTSDRLSASDQPLETGIVDESTQGRVSLNNYLPYILGGLGILLIVVGGVYFWQSSKGRPEARKRHRSQDEDPGGEAVYCHQCGKRAQANDRFCRTCGTRLRKET
jgi:hypothetical protein